MRYPSLLVFVVSACLGSVAVAEAQGGGGLFGATRSDTGATDQFNVTVSLGGGYESEVPAEFRNRVSAGGPQAGGSSIMFDTAAEYAKVGRRARLAGSANTSFRYYQQLGEVLPVSHSAALGASFTLSRAASVELKQAAAYSPSFLFQLFPAAAQPGLGDAVPAAPELRADENASYTYSSGASVSVGSARGSRLTIGADYGRTYLLRDEEAGRSELETLGGSARYGKGFGRASDLSVAYHYTTGDFGLGVTTEHGVTVGGTYVRPLSTSRSLTLRFGLGPAVVSVPELAVTEISGSLYRVHGNVGIDYQFHRRWHVGTAYRRSMELAQQLGAPVLADAVSVDVGGLLSRRLNVSTSLAYAKGQSALTQRNNDLASYTGTAQVRFALTRWLAAYTEYHYYSYEVESGFDLAPGLPSAVEQQGVRAGVTLRVSVF